MADNVGEWSSTAASNESLGAVSLLENVMAVKSVNNAIREMMAQVATGISANAFMAAYTAASASGAASLDFAEDTDNGTNKVTVTAPAALGSDVTVTLPSSTGTLALTSDVPFTAASASGAASLDFAEDTDNGSSTATLIGPASLSGDVTITLPNTTGTLALASQSIWRHIVTDTITSGSPVSSWEKTDLSAYRYLRLTFKLKCTVDDAFIRLRTSTNNGSSYDSTANDYSTVRMIANGTTVTTGGSTAETSFSLTGAGNVPPNEMVTNVVEFFDFNQADYCQMRSDGFSVDGSSVNTIDIRRATRVQSTARDAIQITFSSGTFYGQIILEGIEG